ncbi:hypothetical protein EIN_154220 [Entamoeba invadens IP1]|uniref:Uncharacterized protein n=1 Tax=Entamoeba invadens IP1 TaxID=370355 RepID=A0A0A1U8Y4_ENTIV|nr:hypothetical protein EIN_154220 [Entamoeba invadens IP1]ELP91365.1 hypothetical protein EIN_154220 [Entamoeba invadens IP1]|eukprot:XP_004258136.1 hypothetical protein EIN_154220 [Entamoeba invadens IP1]
MKIFILLALVIFSTAHKNKESKPNKENKAQQKKKETKSVVKQMLINILSFFSAHSFGKNHNHNNATQSNQTIIQNNTLTNHTKPNKPHRHQNDTKPEHHHERNQTNSISCDNTTHPCDNDKPHHHHHRHHHHHNETEGLNKTHVDVTKNFDNNETQHSEDPHFKPHHHHNRHDHHPQHHHEDDNNNIQNNNETQQFIKEHKQKNRREYKRNRKGEVKN